jgi:putative endonuclease
MYSKILGSYYIGSTSDIEERFRLHLSNHSGFTGKAKDWEVVFKEIYESKINAQVRERQIKGWKSRKLIEKLISSAGSKHSDF